MTKVLKGPVKIDRVGGEQYGAKRKRGGKYMNSERGSAFVFSSNMKHWMSKLTKGKNLF